MVKAFSSVVKHLIPVPKAINTAVNSKATRMPVEDQNGKTLILIFFCA